MTIPLRSAKSVAATASMPSVNKKPLRLPSRGCSPPIPAALEIPVQSRRGNQHKASWTPEQDATLMRIINEHGGTGRWRIVAEKLQLETGVAGRGAKHCRERYFNHLDPNINHSEWTELENQILTEAYAQFGTAWSKIAKLLPGRTDNAIKNRWYCQQRKQARRARRPTQRNQANPMSENDEDEDDTGSESCESEEVPCPRRSRKRTLASSDEETELGKRLSIDDTPDDESSIQYPSDDNVQVDWIPTTNHARGNETPSSSPQPPHRYASFASLPRLDSVFSIGLRTRAASYYNVSSPQRAATPPVPSPAVSSSSRPTRASTPSLYRPSSLLTLLTPTVSSYDLHLLLDTMHVHPV